MLFKVPVRFSEGPPSLAALQQRVSERTGLAIKLHCDPDGNAELESPEFPRPCELTVGPDHISLTLPAINSWSYLEYVTIASLVDLGGKSPYETLPKYVNTRWHDRKWWQFIPRG